MSHQLCVRLKRLNHFLIKSLEVCAVGALLLLMFITFIDVVGSKLFLTPVFGSLDIAMLTQLAAIACGTASTLLLGKHIRVEFFLIMLPSSISKPIIVSMLILAFGLFALMALNLFKYGYSLQISGEVSPTAHVPLFPFAYGAALSFIPVCTELFLEAYQTAKGYDEQVLRTGNDR